MQVIFLPVALTVALCFIVWPVLQLSAALFCLYMPDRLFSPNSFLFRTRRFEKEGSVYDSIFKVKRWKHMLPDGGAILKKRGFRKKKLESFSEVYLNRFLVESARGELTHWLAILPFWIFGFFTPWPVMWYMMIYALIVNMPCIIAQRYNRPLIQKLLKKVSTRARGIEKTINL